VAPDNVSKAPARSTTLITVAVVIVGLYFGRIVLIPFALAVLFTFLLAPLVIRFRRWGIPRIPAVLIVIALTFVATLVIGVLMFVQLADLAQKMPEYQQNIRAKMHSVRDSSTGTINRLSSAIHDLSESLTPAMPPPTEPGQEKPVPVEIRGNTFSPLTVVRRILGSVIHVLLSGSIVLVYVIFMLFQREDLRDRFIRLIGAGQINATTQALDDAAQRVSRFLVAQLLLNVAFGVLAGIGLYFMGVPNPILWAMLSALLRYVPYLGIWLAAAMPAAVSLAVSPGWWEPIWIFALFFGIDLVVLNFAEPLLYGTSTGISPMAIVVAAVFWTWLWGPIGLLLATPLTACLAVIGRYVPSLEFLSIALSDEKVLTPAERLYQRLLAHDIDESIEVARECLRQKNLVRFYDDVLVPALVLSEAQRQKGKLKGKLDPARQDVFYEDVRLLIEECEQWPDGLDSASVPAGAARAVEENTQQPFAVVSIPARSQADELVAILVTQLLARRGIPARHTSAVALASEALEDAGRNGARIACICAVPPLGSRHARYLCKRLRAQSPRLKIVAAIFDQDELQSAKQRHPPIQADEFAATLEATLAAILSLAPAAAEPEPAVAHH